MRRFQWTLFLLALIAAPAAATVPRVVLLDKFGYAL